MSEATDQLELFEEDDGLSWDEWFCALPLSPPSKAAVHPLYPAGEQLTFERAA